MIKAVVFDLDDTLYPEMDYVKSGFRAVAKKIKDTYGLDNAEDELHALFAQSRMGVFDRYLKKHSIERTEQSVGELSDTYRYHIPDIHLSDDTEKVLRDLRANGYKLGIITDGSPGRQRLKIQVLGLTSLVDAIIITDELGSVECRKPNKLSFELLCKQFGINPQEMIYVGDNPEKDFAVKKTFPINTLQFQNTGMYVQREYLYGILPDRVVNDIRNIIDSIKDFI